MMEKGWLARHAKAVDEDIKWWPRWMKHAAGVDDGFDAKEEVAILRAALEEAIQGMKAMIGYVPHVSRGEHDYIGRAEEVLKRR